jgi:GMP synthase (glutamine-hydrolysing)
MNTYLSTPVIPIVVVDFGSQYTPLISSVLRKLGYAATVKLPSEVTVQALHNWHTQAILLSGSPCSVYQPEAPRLSEDIWLLDIPILGICYGQQLLIQAAGGAVSPGHWGEYGEAKIALTTGQRSDSPRLQRFIDALTAWVPSTVWMSHQDEVSILPADYVQLASTSSTPFAVLARQDGLRVGYQFHPEVTHTTEGHKWLTTFLECCANIRPQTRQNSQHQLEHLRASILQNIQPSDRVLIALSGGVDSAVMTALLASVLRPEQLVCMCIDTGLLREHELSALESMFAQHLHIPVEIIDARHSFLQALQGVVDPEAKRKIIGAHFIEVFTQSCQKLTGITHFAQGTLLSDRLESGSLQHTRQTIKSHHNVGGLPETLPFKLIEPLRDLLKDEVRELGVALGLPRFWCERQPFPGPGLAVRIAGEVTAPRLAKVRQADSVVQHVLSESGHLAMAWQSFAMLLPVASVGVKGDMRSYDETIVVRSVLSDNGMTARTQPLPPDLLALLGRKILNEVAGVGRVLYDISDKPPSTIEWE